MSDSADPEGPGPSKTITLLVSPFLALVIQEPEKDQWTKGPWTCRLPTGSVRQVTREEKPRFHSFPSVCWAEHWEEPGARAYAAYARATLDTFVSRPGYADDGSLLPTWDELIERRRKGDAVAQRTLCRWRAYVTRLPDLPREGLSFGQAHQWLEEGERVRRTGWGERGGHIGHIAMRRISVVDGKPVRPHTYHEDALGMQAPWVPTQEDMYARDWAVLRSDAIFSG